MNESLRAILAEERARVLTLEREARAAQAQAAHVRDTGRYDQRQQRDAYAAARGKTEGWAEAHARLRAAERGA